MYLRKRSTFVQNLSTLTVANLPAQTKKISIDRTWPLEEIIVIVTATAKAALSSVTAFGLLNLLKRATLEVNDGIQPRKIVDATGYGLLAMAINEGANLDRATLETIIATNTPATINTGIYQVAYRIPLVHPQFTEGLRVRSLLPINLYQQDPVLTLEFGAAADISGTADPFSAISYHVVLVKREMSAAQIGGILNSGGFISSDLVETQFPIAALTGSEQRFTVPSPGQYTGLTMVQLNNSILADLSASTTIGSETRWRIESGQVVLRDWAMKFLQIENDYSRPLNRAVQASVHGLGAPIDAAGATTGTAWTGSKPFFVPGSLGGAMAAGQCVQIPAVVTLDFLSDGLTDANELGSLLDTNLPADKGLKVEIIGSVTTTGTSSLNLIGRRLFGDLSKYQAYKG